MLTSKPGLLMGRAGPVTRSCYTDLPLSRVGIENSYRRRCSHDSTLKQWLALSLSEERCFVELLIVKVDVRCDS